MAEMESMRKEWVEGFDDTGKPLERITKSEQLQEQQRKMKKEEVELNKALQKEQFEMLELQNKLKECNDEYTQERQNLDELRSQQRVTLDTDQKFRILSVTKETIDRFLRKRPKLEDEQMVDVHFLTGTETTGFNLHINGEGAGSRDAKFLVHLNEKVESLGKQAAKYWGLDPDKVFFLDGDGRIVLDNMTLVDIILPPARHLDGFELPKEHNFCKQPKDPKVCPSKLAELTKLKFYCLGAAEGERRNYCLTLVRASTVLSKEDLNRPKGEKWEDFTFNERQLEKELENARKKRGGEDGEAAKINMDIIPSLNDLMQQGQEKKRRKRADTRCRLLEFSVFVVCQVSGDGYAHPDIDARQCSPMLSEVNMASAGNSNHLNFINSDYNEDKHDKKCHTDTGHEHLHYFCCLDRLDRLDCTNVSVPTPVTVNPGDISCIPEQFRYCSNLRAMHILGKGQELGHEVPNCVPLYDINIPNAYLHSLTHPQVFSYANGKIGSYFEGDRSFLDVSNGTEAFRQSLESFTLSTGEPFTFQGSAQQLTTVVYGATTNAIFIFHFLVENRLSGGLVTSIHKDVFLLDLEPVESHVYLLLACASAVLLLLMEMRRIFHCPAACTFEEERTKCSIWSLLFLVLPAMILAISCLMLVQDTFTGNLLEAGRTSDAALYDYLWLRIKLDRSRLTIVVITLFLFNALMLKYLLLHFPQLLSATQIVKKLAAPLITVLVLTCVTVFSFGVFLYAVFGTAFRAFEGIATTWLNVVLWSMGYIKDWQAYYRFQPALWTFSIFVALCLIQLTLNVLPAVIMLSHKKEADLVENYSYHAYWASERSKNSGKKSFNPALVGWDFTDPKDPREVEH
ncbi:unnamed protein product [Cladocopium goreaui]|uniref:Polycystin domain-containing protein n=1 Tax=Cladocopium goreaui TaxID=2562237 RepID=A0A9P1FPJ3_9DINO|nr:unnamed protein product [Cladocopium goreaui]